MARIFNNVDNTIISSSTIRKDFWKDYECTLLEYGFVKRRNILYRIHGNDIILYVSLNFFRSEWTVTFASYAFASAYRDLKGYDGIRMNSILECVNHDQTNFNIFRVLDRTPENYQYIRKLYHTVFFEYVFPIFNSVTSIDTYIKFKNWHANIENLIPDYENLALASFQAHEYNQGASYLKQYLQDKQRSYKRRIMNAPDNFTREYEMYTGFVNDVRNNCTTNIDTYIKSRIAITTNTCSELGLIINKA